MGNMKTTVIEANWKVEVADKMRVLGINRWVAKDLAEETFLKLSIAHGHKNVCAKFDPIEEGERLAKIYKSVEDRVRDIFHSRYDGPSDKNSFRLALVEIWREATKAERDRLEGVYKELLWFAKQVLRTGDMVKLDSPTEETLANIVRRGNAAIDAADAETLT